MTATARPLSRDAKVIGLVGGGHFFSHFYMLVLPPLFPLLKAEFDISYTALGSIVTAYALAAGVAQIPVGFLVDRVGARFPLIVGLALVAGSVLLMGLTSTYSGLLLLALMAGLGGSVFHPADYSILSASIDAGRLGRAFAAHTFSGLFGWAMAPPVMIFLTALWSWRTALVVVGCVGLVAALVLLARRHELRDDTRARADGAGATPSTRGSAALLLSAPILLLFAFFVVIALISSGIHSFSVIALMQLRGLDLTAANAVLTGFLAAGAVGVLLGGVVADRTERYDAVAAVGFLAAAILVLCVATFAMPLVLLVFTFSLAGLMQGAIWPSRDMIVRSLTPAGSSGKVFGFVSSGLDIGAAVSPVLFGWIVDQGRPDGVFWLIAAFMLAGLLAATAAARLARRTSLAYAP